MREFVMSDTALAIAVAGGVLLLVWLWREWWRERREAKEKRRSEDLRRRNKQSFADMARQIGEGGLYHGIL